jgi:hypothetical protein
MVQTGRAIGAKQVCDEASVIALVRRLSSYPEFWLIGFVATVRLCRLGVSRRMFGLLVRGWGW